MLIRRLEWTPRGGAPRVIEVEIGPPVEASGEWTALLTVRGFDAPYSMPLAGVDSMHAVLGAVMVASTIVPAMARGGRLTWVGGKDLGLGPPRLSLWRRLRARWRGWRWYRHWRRGR